MTDETITLLKAIKFATIKHHGQLRKYNDDPYIVHLFRVAEDLLRYGVEEPAITCAILHDVLEDTNATYEELETEFGTVIADIVFELTDPPVSAGNRAVRKAMTRERLANASYYAKTVKCADIIDNLDSIMIYDPKFGKVFLEEVKLLYPLLKGAEESLWNDLGLVIKRNENDN